MKRSDLNHLRRLVAWVRVEVGQTPEEIVATAQSVADGLGHPEMSDAAKLRLIDSYDRARNVPKYVREAVAALSKYLETEGPVVAEACQDSSAPSALSAPKVPQAVQQSSK